LKRYVGVLHKNRVLAQPELRPLVVNHVYDLVAAMIGPTRDGMELAMGRGIRAARLSSIRADVIANLSEVQLSARTVAARHGFSDRYVHVLFEETGKTFSQFVEEEKDIMNRAVATMNEEVEKQRRTVAAAEAEVSRIRGEEHIVDLNPEGTEDTAAPVNTIVIKQETELNEADGKLLWKHEYGCPYSVSYPAGPRATPLVSGGKVYTLGAEGNLCCLDARGGKLLWSRDFKKDYGIPTPLWGFSAHPLLDGNKLVCLVGGAAGNGRGPGGPGGPGVRRPSLLGEASGLQLSMDFDALGAAADRVTSPEEQYRFLFALADFHLFSVI
jgi:AraC-like DNA-binding protein